MNKFVMSNLVHPGQLDPFRYLPDHLQANRELETNNGNHGSISFELVGRPDYGIRPKRLDDSSLRNQFIEVGRFSPLGLDRRMW